MSQNPTIYRGNQPAIAAQEARPPSRDGGLRIAHLTDMHVEPGDHRGGEGYAAALGSLQRISHRPQLIITGGDHVMESTTRGPADSAAQWDLYHRVLADHTDLRVYPVLGNHDVMGWGVPELASSTAGYGKAMYLDRMGLDQAYYTFDAGGSGGSGGSGGWRFICLDNVVQRGTGYCGDLDPQQADWLARELTATPADRSVCILTHIPLLSACVYFDANIFRDDAYVVPDWYMHRNVRPLLGLLASHPQVKLCLSGHLHLVDRVDYLGLSFICSGAVCGGWWKGPYRECPGGYVVLDLYPDGTFEHQYVTFGWAGISP